MLRAVPDSTDSATHHTGSSRSSGLQSQRREPSPASATVPVVRSRVAETGMGRRRQYCRQSCRQRAYEQRALVKGSAVPPDAVVLSADEAAELADRVYQVRCAAGMWRPPSTKVPVETSCAISATH